MYYNNGYDYAIHVLQNMNVTDDLEIARGNSEMYLVADLMDLRDAIVSIYEDKEDSGFMSLPWLLQEFGIFPIDPETLEMKIIINANWGKASARTILTTDVDDEGYGFGYDADCGPFGNRKPRFLKGNKQFEYVTQNSFNGYFYDITLKMIVE